MTRIRYDRADFGCQIVIYPPSDKYPMYQVYCNDDDSCYFGTTVAATQEDVDRIVGRILNGADCVEVLQ